ncbi:MAG: hypothetical protein IT520_17805 [Burkholderiales bacterium]|nr:hypothetical protein [Burkholderiales bacterium]
MIDEAAWREARNAAAPLACVYAPALLAGCASCTLAQRRSLAERVAVGCASADARDGCARFLAALRERAAFALRLRADAPLRHAAAMKLQCGGLSGLAEAAGAGDVHALVSAALTRAHEGAEPAWPSIVAAVARWEIRPRRGRGK